MAEVTTTHRVCDRPGCGAKLTESGAESVGLTAEAGPAKVVVNDNYGKGTSPDLCRECFDSLVLWWTGKQRRREK